MDVEIGDLALGGSGVGKIHGFVILVRRAVPGDVVRVRITARKPNYAEAEIVENLGPSPLRVSPRCRLFEECGGCQWMSLQYEHQLDAKERQVGEALARIGGLSGFTLHPIIRSPEIYKYRNKLELAFADGPGGLTLGFHQVGSETTVVDSRGCLIGSERMDEVARAARDLLSEAGYRPAPWEGPSRDGDGRNERLVAKNGDKDLLRQLVLREGRRTGEMLVGLITVDGPMPDEKGFAESLMTRFPFIVGVVRTVEGRRRGLRDGAERILAGRGDLRESLGGITYEISPSAFFQVNSEQAENLYARTRELALDHGRDSVLDLYCGVGGLTLFLAARARRVTGVESSPEAVRCAIAGAARNRVGNVKFILGEARRIVKRLAAADRRYDVVVLNPPRSGIHEDMLDGVPSLSPRRIVYVSCNPATLARDLSGLSARGYRLTEVQPMDMFPHSFHVETIARLERSG